MSDHTCVCEKPKSVEAAEDSYESICGVVVWCGGVEYEACEHCGHPITDPVKRTIPLAEDPKP